MLLALLTTAVFLPAGSLHVDETAAEQRLIGDTLDRLRAGVAFLRRALRAAGTPVVYVETWRGSPYLIYIIITDIEVRSKRLSNANLPSAHEEPITPDENSTYGVRPGVLAELLR